MSYGSHAYGSAAFGGLPGARFVFFSSPELHDAGTYRRSTEYTGNAEFFEVITKNEGAADDPERVMRVYTHNDPGESPQLQVTVGVEAFYTQTIIAAARFIVVEVEVPTEAPGFPTILITGNEYFQ